MTINVSGQFAVYLKSKGIDLNQLKNISAKEFEVLTSLFVKYCKGNANVDTVDFSGVQLPTGVSEAESRTFFQVLKEFFSLETIKLKADTIDKDGYLSEEEVRVFLEQYVNDVDNNGSDISLDDLEGALTNFGITLPTTPSPSPAPSGDSDGSGGTGGTGDKGDKGDGDKDIDDLPLPDAVDYAALAAQDSANYTDTPLEALYDLRDDLVGDIQDARTNLQSIQNGTNPAVVQLMANRDNAQEALYAAMEKDSEAVKAILQELKDNDTAVDENDKQTIETLSALSDKQAALGEVEAKLAATDAAIATTSTNLTSAQGELAALGSKPGVQKDAEGNETEASRQARANYDTNKAALDKRISDLNNELTRLQAEKTALETQKTGLETEITALETTLETLKTEAETLNTTRQDIMTRFNEMEKNPETEAAKQKWEEASKAYNTGTAQLYAEYSQQLQDATIKLNAIEYAIIQKENEVKSNGEEPPAWDNKANPDSKPADEPAQDVVQEEGSELLVSSAEDTRNNAQTAYNEAVGAKQSILDEASGKMNGAIRAELLDADADIRTTSRILEAAQMTFDLLTRNRGKV